MAVFERYETGEEDGRKVRIQNRNMPLSVGIEHFSDGVGIAVENLRGGLQYRKIVRRSPEVEE
jgi:hypothetical protein